MQQINDLKHYFVITFSYWAFTITDGAIRMLVVLYFHQLGYSPLEIALLFVFYEFFGIVTNLVGGWIGSRIGLNKTMHVGMGLQILALMSLTVPTEWLSVAYVMAAQAASGIAKDLNKMSAKASVKLMLPSQADASENERKLFKWVAILTGSKNTLKGAGYFIGGFLLAVAEFRGALYILAGGLAIVLVLSIVLLPIEIGKTKAKTKFTQLFSRSREINWLSAARFFLFGSRDVWFVVALPVFLSATLGWTHTQTGSFLALWIIGYGFVQSSAPALLRKTSTSGNTAIVWTFLLALIPAGIAIALNSSMGNHQNTELVLMAGLAFFGIVFAINSAVHSYLILSYSDHDKVAVNVGFYYMANAGGRLTGTVLSGWAFQQFGLTGCLWISAAFVLAAGLFSLPLRKA
jgi:predicted MFS family arabinose efflux permease